jgi:hypothetical protein
MLKENNKGYVNKKMLLVSHETSLFDHVAVLFVYICTVEKIKSADFKMNMNFD